MIAIQLDMFDWQPGVPYLFCDLDKYSLALAYTHIRVTSHKTKNFYDFVLVAKSRDATLLSFERKVKDCPIKNLVFVRGKKALDAEKKRLGWN